MVGLQNCKLARAFENSAGRHAKTCKNTAFLHAERQKPVKTISKPTAFADRLFIHHEPALKPVKIQLFSTGSTKTL